MGVAGVCISCANRRYCGIPDPDCRYCGGRGRVIGGDVEGWNGVVVLRAALMALDERKDRAVLIKKGLLAERATQVVNGTLPSGGDAAAVGRQAGQLLVSLGLRPAKTRKVVTPAERAERKRKKAAEKEHMRLIAAHWDRQAQERANERRRIKVERAAQAALAAAHPEEFEHEREAQEVFVALDEGFGTYMPPAVRRVLEP